MEACIWTTQDASIKFRQINLIQYQENIKLRTLERIDPSRYRIPVSLLDVGLVISDVGCNALDDSCCMRQYFAWRFEKSHSAA